MLPNRHSGARIPKAIYPSGGVLIGREAVEWGEERHLYLLVMEYLNSWKCPFAAKLSLFSPEVAGKAWRFEKGQVGREGRGL